MSNAIAGDFDKAVKLALEVNQTDLAQKYIRKATALLSSKERKLLWLQVAEKLFAKDTFSSLDYLMSKSPL
jgi:Flp pilus assembly protein TadD